MLFLSTDETKLVEEIAFVSHALDLVGYAINMDKPFSLHNKLSVFLN